VWRIGLVAYVLIAFSCDPINNITVKFAVQPEATVHAFWVTKYQGRTYAHNTVFAGDVTTPEFSITKQECCGTAAAYRDHELWFLACVANAGRDPTLVCGRPGDPDAKLVRSTPHGTTCAEIERTIEEVDIDLSTCTLSASAGRPPSGSRATP
jgi:hypothetical protein